LAVCKSRFGIDQSCLFSPHDVQESTEDVKESQAAMLRVLTILIMLCRSSGHNLNLDGVESTTTPEPTVTPVSIPTPTTTTTAVVDDEPTPEDLISPRGDDGAAEKEKKEAEEKAELERMTAQILAEKKSCRGEKTCRGERKERERTG
jgi:hypothetical protein